MYTNVIICEDNTVVINDKENYREFKQESLDVRVEIDEETQDAEFVSVKELCELYRKHVLNK